MPATEDVWRNLRTLHIVSAASALALFAATLYMMQADYDDEWRGIQRVAYQQEAEQIDEDLASLKQPEFEAQEQELRQKIDEAQKTVDAEHDKVSEAQKKVDELDGQYQILSRKVRFQRAE